MMDKKGTKNNNEFKEFLKFFRKNSLHEQTKMIEKLNIIVNKKKENEKEKQEVIQKFYELLNESKISFKEIEEGVKHLKKDK